MPHNAVCCAAQMEHLQAQVYLLEADVSNRQHGTESPRTPSRDPEEAAELLHQQIEHLHNENVRLHDEVNQQSPAVHAEVNQQLLPHVVSNSLLA